jgi:type VI secretion system secreted protein VgrG
MTELTQKGKLIAISVDGQEDDALLLLNVAGSESMSRPFAFQLGVVTTKTDIDASKILGQKAIITLQTLDPDKPRYISGFVTRFSQSDSSDGLHHYSMEVGPWISFLGLNVDYMIFHNQTIPEIIKKVFDNSPAKQKDTVDTSKLSGSYTKLEYCVQYRESTLRFLSRLMEQAGIFFYFAQTDQGHTLHLVDDSSQCEQMNDEHEFSYLYRNSEDPLEEVILSLQAQQGVKTGAHTHSNYNFKTPWTDLKTSEQTVISAGQNQDLEIFEYPSTHMTIAEGKALSKLRMQEQEATQNLISGTSRIRGLAAGYKFSIKDHPTTGAADRNIEYLVVEVQHMISAGGAYTGGGGGESYSNQFTCIPASVPYRPKRATPKPLILGLQNAVVVGKSQDSTNSDDPDNPSSDGEEIWVDKYGRVMVRFPWDRAGACSCWVRVSQEWAGQGWGAITIPRVGQEVLVSFFDGDPDRPIITGRVYNATQVVPYPLPDNQTRSTFMTRSSKNGSSSTYHELRFEDKTGSEQVFFRSQKDYDNYIVNDSREWVGNNRSLIVTKDQMESVGGDRHEQVTGKNIVKIGGDRQENLGANETITIGGNRNETVSGNHVETISGDLNSNISGNLNQKVGSTMSLQVGENLYEKSGSNYAHQAGQMIHLKAGMTVVIEAGTELCLKVGGNFIDINPSGVSIVGTMVMINSGGSAGSGCGSSPTDPTSPESPTDPTAPDKADDGSKGTKLN